jgi:hypothetical protein
LVASFRSESMLRQEEALAELDASIDDWVGKLEQAENRRTRVRQKLLEHVCAATTLRSSPAVVSVPAAAAAIEPLHSAMCIQPAMAMGVGNISTPPRSPNKAASERTHSRNGSADSTASAASVSSAPAPSRGGFTAHVPSTIFEQPMVEEVAAALATDNPRASCLTRDDVESIRVYADSDVYALLADVEHEFTQMSADMFGEGPSDEASRFEAEREHHLAQSKDLLVGGAPDMAKPMPLSPLPPPAPSKDSPTFAPSKAAGLAPPGSERERERERGPSIAPPSRNNSPTLPPLPYRNAGVAPPPVRSSSIPSSSKRYSVMPPPPPLAFRGGAALAPEQEQEDVIVFLSSAVFRPDRPSAAV